MATTKKAAAKKSPAKKSPAKKAPAKKAAAKSDGPTAREVREERDAELMPQIVEAREAGTKWAEISESLGIAEGKAMLLYNIATVKPKERIKGDDAAVAAGIVEARDEEGVSWGVIAARAGMPETRVRSIWREATGKTDKGNRIGKGGRWPAGQGPDPAAKASKGASKKAPAKKAPAKKSKWDGMDADAIMSAIEGKTVAAKIKGKQQKFQGDDVDDIVGEGPDAELTFGDVTFTARAITRVS